MREEVRSGYYKNFDGLRSCLVFRCEPHPLWGQHLPQNHHIPTHRWFPVFRKGTKSYLCNLFFFFSLSLFQKNKKFVSLSLRSKNSSFFSPKFFPIFINFYYLNNLSRFPFDNSIFVKVVWKKYSVYIYLFRYRWGVYSCCYFK